MVPAGGIGSDQFTETGAEGSVLPKYGLGELSEVLGGLGFKGEKVPDLGILAIEAAHAVNRGSERAQLGVCFDIGEEKGFQGF